MRGTRRSEQDDQGRCGEKLERSEAQEKPRKTALSGQKDISGKRQQHACRSDMPRHSGRKKRKAQATKMQAEKNKWIRQARAFGRIEAGAPVDTGKKAEQASCPGPG